MKAEIEFDSAYHEVVQWKDLTFDTQRICSECQSVSCKFPVHPENYREIEKPGFARAEEKSAYWDWMETHASRNPETGELDEASTSNPDVLPDTHDYQI